MKPILAYLLVINAAAFLLMLADKFRARKKLWRIPEAALIGTALVGGSLGALIGMYTFRHKTRHIKFTLGVPLILSVQFILIFLLLK